MGRIRRHRAELAEAQMVLALPGVALSTQRDAPVQVPSPVPSGDSPVEPERQERKIPVPASTAPTDDAPTDAGAHDRTPAPSDAGGELAVRNSTCILPIPSVRRGTSDRVSAPPEDVEGQNVCILETIGSYPPQDACHVTRVELGVPITQLVELYEVLRPFVCNEQGQPGAPVDGECGGGEGTGRSK